MGVREPAHPARLRRLEEELAEAGFEPGGSTAWREMLLVELDYALRPERARAPRRRASAPSSSRPPSRPRGRTARC